MFLKLSNSIVFILIFLITFLLKSIIGFTQTNPAKTYHIEFINFPKLMQDDIESRFISKTVMLNESHRIKIVDNIELTDTKNEFHKFELFSNNNKNGIIKIKVKYYQEKLPSPETYRGKYGQYYSVEHYIFEKNKWRRTLNMGKFEILPYELETLDVGSEKAVLQKVANTIMISTYK